MPRPVAGGLSYISFTSSAARACEGHYSAPLATVWWNNPRSSRVTNTKKANIYLWKIRRSRSSLRCAERRWRSVSLSPLAEIDPLYYDASYFAVPEKAGQKPYHLLVEIMKDSGKVALAKVVMHQREYVVAIRPR